MPILQELLLSQAFVGLVVAGISAVFVLPVLLTGHLTRGLSLRRLAFPLWFVALAAGTFSSLAGVLWPFLPVESTLLKLLLLGELIWLSAPPVLLLAASVRWLSTRRLLGSGPLLIES